MFWVCLYLFPVVSFFMPVCVHPASLIDALGAEDVHGGLTGVAAKLSITRAPLLRERLGNDHRFIALFREGNGVDERAQASMICVPVSAWGLVVTHPARTSAHDTPRAFLI